MRPGEAISSSMRHLAEIKGVPKALLLLFSFLFFYSVSIGPIQKFNPMSFSFLFSQYCRREIQCVSSFC